MRLRMPTYSVENTRLKERQSRPGEREIYGRAYNLIVTLFGAGDGNRTHDIQLGKLCLLSLFLVSLQVVTCCLRTSLGTSSGLFAALARGPAAGLISDPSFHHLRHVEHRRGRDNRTGRPSATACRIHSRFSQPSSPQRRALRGATEPGNRRRQGDPPAASSPGSSTLCLLSMTPQTGLA